STSLYPNLSRAAYFRLLSPEQKERLIQAALNFPSPDVTPENVKPLDPQDIVDIPDQITYAQAQLLRTAAEFHDPRLLRGLLNIVSGSNNYSFGMWNVFTVIRIYDW